MKKIVNTYLMIAVLSVTAINYVDALPPRQPVVSEAVRDGQKKIRMLSDKIQKTTDEYRVAKTKGVEAEKEALMNAKKVARELIGTLNDITIFGNDVVRGYVPEQIRQACIALAELLTRKNAVETEARSIDTQLKNVTSVGIFFSSALPGKGQTRDQYLAQQQDLKAVLKDVNKAILDQEMIAGKEWSSAIKDTVHNLLVGSSLGISYGIKWYFRGSKISTEPTKKHEPHHHQQTFRRK